MTKEFQLNGRQSKVLQYLLDQVEINVREMERICPDVNRRTLQRDLKQMEDVGIIRRKGAARQSVYILETAVT